MAKNVTLVDEDEEVIDGYRIVDRLYFDTDRYLVKCTVAVYDDGLLFSDHLFSQVGNEWMNTTAIEKQIDSLHKSAITKLNNCDEGFTIDE